MSNEIIPNGTPDYITHEGMVRKLQDYSFTLPAALTSTQMFIVADFGDQEGRAISVSSGVIVKVTATGTPSAISAGNELNGYRIAYQSAAGDSAGDAITGTLEYWGV